MLGFREGRRGEEWEDREKGEGKGHRGSRERGAEARRSQERDKERQQE